MSIVSLSFILAVSTIRHATTPAPPAEGKSRITSCSSRQAPPATPPDTPAGKRLGRWLDLFNRGDYDGLLAFHQSAGSRQNAERRALQDYRLFLLTRGVQLRRVESKNGVEFHVLGQESVTRNWVSLLARFSPAAPFDMVGIGLAPAEPPKEARPARRHTTREIIDELDRVATALAREDVFSGAILLAKDGKPLYRKAFGAASKAYSAANRVDTKFNLASMGKMFTGVAALQLIQAGKLSFDDTIGKWLPDWPNRDAAAKVTVRHLLTHTSGLGSDVFNAKFIGASRDRYRQVSDFLPLYSDAPLDFEPGTKWSYSNAGFMTLGAIIEKASGEEYWAYVRNHIFRPAGMADTDAYEMDHDTPNLAIGYTRSRARTRAEIERRQNNLFLHVIKGTPAGGCYSTAGDLFRFSEALQGGKLLSEEFTHKIMTGQVDTGRPGDRYGFGVQEEVRNGKRILGHRGGFEGISTVLNMIPQTGYTFVVLSNYDTVAQSIAFLLQRLITQG